MNRAFRLPEPKSPTARTGSQPHRRFVLDGEAVLLDASGISDFNALHSRKRDAEVQLYAFNCLAADVDDLRKLPLSLRKTNLARIPGPPRRRHSRNAVRAGRDRARPVPARLQARLESLVSKHRDSTYRSGRFDRWVGGEPAASGVQPGDGAVLAGAEI
jgi:bifunctional non-homologous end joining protein LigD